MYVGTHAAVVECVYCTTHRQVLSYTLRRSGRAPFSSILYYTIPTAGVYIYMYRILYVRYRYLL